VQMDCRRGKDETDDDFDVDVAASERVFSQRHRKYIWREDNLLAMARVPVLNE